MTAAVLDRAGPARRQRMRAPASAVGGLAAATLALRLRDPHQDGSWGFCPIALMGVWCPACGSLRAVNDLTHLRLEDALSSNLLLVLAAPVVVLLLVRWTRDRWTGRVRAPLSPDVALRWAVVLVPLLLAFAVLRNLPVPWGLWLAP